MIETLGMQMDLMGAHAVGLRNILAVTGDPPKMGTYPDATAVFDIDSVGLINFIQGMNRGVDFWKVDRRQDGALRGCRLQSRAVDMHHEAERFGRKVEAGYTSSRSPCSISTCWSVSSTHKVMV